MRHFMAAGTALLALAGCGSGTPEAERGNAAGAAAAPAAADGRSEVRGDADFSGLPEGIPAYPRVSGAGAVQFGGVSDGNEMRVMGFRTADPPATVIAFYADAATRAGFREIQRATSGPSEVLGLARANGEAMTVTATAAPGGTNVQIMAGRGRAPR